MDACANPAGAGLFADHASGSGRECDISLSAGERTGRKTLSLGRIIAKKAVKLSPSEISKIFKKLLDIFGKVSIISNVPAIEDLCNGSTPDSDSVCGGSNPSSSAKK